MPVREGTGQAPTRLVGAGNSPSPDRDDGVSGLGPEGWLGTSWFPSLPALGGRTSGGSCCVLGDGSQRATASISLLTFCPASQSSILSCLLRPISFIQCRPPQPRRSVRPRAGRRRSLDAQALRDGPHPQYSRTLSHPGTGSPTASLLQPRFQGVGAGGPAMLLPGPGSGCNRNTCFCY